MSTGQKTNDTSESPYTDQAVTVKRTAYAISDLHWSFSHFVLESQLAW